MYIELLGSRILLILKKYYIEESIKSFEEALDADVSSPAKKGLQKINENLPKLYKQEVYKL